ncbi:MAG: putative DNA binding domain-containing protein, partial [Bifidobacteriaceae bacterium]|nr:putative DNA binding domain-containing protein [Bifidobacteriaceae bacterium]
MPRTWDDAIAELRRQGSDTEAVEAKAAGRGFPHTVAETISAFANRPGGGLIIFGLDESHGFAPAGVYNVAKCQQAVAAVARTAVEPPAEIHTEVASLEGTPIVLAYVREMPVQMKPIRVKTSGLAYLRQYDGDYALSDQEVQTLIAARGNPTFDTEPVPGASISDLDQATVAAFIAERRRQSSVLAAADDNTVLLRTGVLVDGHPSLAALLAFGVYPQQFFPTLGIQGTLLPSDSERQLGNVRARVLDAPYFTGPIPAMLRDAIAWVERVTPTAIVDDPASGAVRDRP